MSQAPRELSTGALPRVDVAVIGGSGLYSLFPRGASDEVIVDTPYGPTSSPVSIGELGGKRVAFLTRHGGDHSVPPHQIGYRANIWALAALGAKAIVSSSAVGGVHPDYPPGTMVITDQFIDRTWGRADTFYDQGSVQHLSAADPFDPTLRDLAVDALAKELGSFAPSGTCVVIQGPRFSTRAESLWWRQAGAHTVNMTMVPEVPLAGELNIGTVNLSFVTDADAGLAPSDDDAEADVETVSHGLVMARLAEAQPLIVAAIERIVASIPSDFTPRQLIPAEAVDAVLSRPVSGDPRLPE
ncbi:MTAP family purine nucleoside phosphorylase [Frondihabitans sp. VKM Ac-2883]|uniref:MTAP family purine nucleoside phosphorylase n=1 Tax=Frondihabitans sp. VKM Ac-2883 TaxID=2783823 RepID=UPI00188AE375|nr:MTAP family purine nucleoside phosphorylase [Frondihabitans sp. VKM Ac-2883]MBF4574801.1 MTAP family purine nucleoside phosphorylase [Frondihabitans sp. VKM Ac-2883]